MCFMWAQSISENHRAFNGDEIVTKELAVSHSLHPVL